MVRLVRHYTFDGRIVQGEEYSFDLDTSEMGASKSWLGLAAYLKGRVAAIFECGIIDSAGVARDFEVDSADLMRSRICW